MFLFKTKNVIFFLARDSREQDYLIFKEVLDNVARIDKVLTQPAGSLVLAGRSGVGRHTAVYLVAHMHQVNIVSPKVSRAYGLKQFKVDLKTVSYFLFESHSTIGFIFLLILATTSILE